MRSSSSVFSLVLGCALAAMGARAIAQSAAADKAFVKKAAEGGLAEVKLGQLAADKASNADVKQFGQRMVEDHTSLNNQMKPIADNMGVAVPDSLAPKEQAIYDRLNGLSGDQFDKAYINAMVKDHHDDLREFTREEHSARDKELKTAVSEGRSVIEQHTKMADELARRMHVSGGMLHSSGKAPCM